MTPRIHIVGRRTVEYVIECLLYAEKYDEIQVNAYGGNVSKAIEVAHVLEQYVGYTIKEIHNFPFKLNGNVLPAVKINVLCHAYRQQETQDPIIENLRRLPHETFINYPTYSLLVNHMMRQGSLDVFIEAEGMECKVMNIKDSGNEGLHYTTFLETVPEEAARKMRIIDKLGNTLIRAGITMPTYWKQIAQRISQHDDILLGLDTNMFYNCSMTAHLLPAISIIEPVEFVHTPNWIMLVVPGTVIHELEESTNLRKESGLLTYEGRMGFRALQEIMELSQSVDIQGVSLLVAGETDPILDTKADLKGIKEGIYDLVQHMSETSYRKRPRKSSVGDMTIRNQYKQFLRSMDFHKGTVFLTADKSNAALAMAEGLDSLYVKYENELMFQGAMHTVKPMRISNNYAPEPGKKPVNEFGKNEKFLRVEPTLGNVLYELAVSFGKVTVQGPEGPGLTLKCDQKGESLIHWVHKQLRVNSHEIREVVKNYKGKHSLSHVHELYHKLNKQLGATEWLKELEGIFERPDNED